MRTIPKIFRERDPFNPENVLEGILYVDNDHYGDLLIKKVNDEETHQYINTTPKFYYPKHSSSPFKRSKITWGCKKLLIYDKIDGTNIFCFSYKYKGKEFISYKTRLSPFVKNNVFYRLYDLFCEIKEKKIKRDIPGAAYELYGNRCQVIVNYDVDLNLKMLYIIDSEGNILPPPSENELSHKPIYSLNNVTATEAEDLYVRLEKQADEEFLDGRRREGFMLYMLEEDGKWHAYKCKSKELLKLSMKRETIPKTEIETTMFNAMEMIGPEKAVNLTIDQLKDLLFKYTCDLLSEDHDYEIALKKEKTKRRVRSIINKRIMIKIIMDAYYNVKSKYPDSLESPIEVMRKIKEFIPRGYEQYTYSTLKKLKLI